MPYTNSFFSNTTGYSAEVSLIDDLCREQIKIYGIDIMYMPRKMLNLDKLLHESSKTAFEIALPMPVYIKSFDGYDQGMELLTKFGVRSADQITFVMSRSEFTTYYAPFLKEYYEGINEGGALKNDEGQTDQRPKEGDLIYFPFDDGIFEIKYVMFDQPFFQLGNGYTFEMRCEKFEYSGEEFSTGVVEIDDVVDNTRYYSREFTLESGGSGTFQELETVKIYNLEDNPLATNPSGNVITGEDDEVLSVEQKEFRMYGRPGFLEDVPFVTATIAKWDKPGLKLTLTQFSNEDPTQKDPDNDDVDIDRLEKCLIIGQTSSANWKSVSSALSDNTFNDDIVIQEEFDNIKIIDPADTNPFGFI